MNVQAQCTFINIWYSRATAKEEERGVKQLISSGIQREAYGKGPSLSSCCAKNILANALNRELGHMMISFYEQHLTGCTSSEVCLIFLKGISYFKIGEAATTYVKAHLMCMRTLPIITSKASVALSSQDHFSKTKITI